MTAKERKDNMLYMKRTVLCCEYCAHVGHAKGTLMCLAGGFPVRGLGLCKEFGTKYKEETK